jgi:nucleoside-diphosphate-sugar epimerase
MSLEVLVIGATGYVGAAVARAFQGRGWATHGLSRDGRNEAALTAAGVRPVPGDLQDLPALGRIAGRFDVVAMCASIAFEDEPGVMRALIEAAARRGGGHVIFTSGTGVLSLESRDGAWDEQAFAEDDPFPFPARPVRTVRLPTEDLVRAAGDRGVRTSVVRPPLIWGNGGSTVISLMFQAALRTGVSAYLGQGLNVFSNVHVDDVAEVYALAVERGRPGGLYHCVAGEAGYRAIAEAVAAVVGCDTRSIGYEAACALWGTPMVEMAFAVNSRSVAPRTRETLGWVPRRLDLIADVRSGSYRQAFEAGLLRPA